MYKNVPTLTDFLLQEERKFPKATGSFTLLMVQFENAVKVINSHIRASGLVDILGKTGGKNVYNEEVMKLDILSHNILVDMLQSSGQVHTIVSEELEKELVIPASYQGEYIIYFDPLDGSSNIDTNSPIGTIFSIYHKDKGLFQQGKHQVAAGYVMYGSSTMFIYSSGNGVNGFTLDPAVGTFLLSHPHIKIPEEGNIYSINEGNAATYTDALHKYLTKIKSSEKYKLRYVGSLIADIHRTLLKGGIFLYPSDKNHPEGKLRLMIEVNPMSFLVTQAGGKAVSTKENSLDILPVSIHERSAVIMGSSKNVDDYLTYV